MTTGEHPEADEHGPDRVPDLWVEKLALGELPEDQARAVRQRLGDQADERLAALAASNEEILREHPPARVAAEVQRRFDRLEDHAERSRSGWMVWSPVAVGAAMALVWWVVREEPSPGPGSDGVPVIAQADPEVVPDPPPQADGGLPPEQIRLKGDPVLMVDRVVDGRPQRLAAEAPVAAGDLLQVRYNAKGAQQGVVVSIDGAGVATLHFPATETDSPRLDHGGPTPLPESYELDDAPGFERFFFVTVDEAEPPLDVAQVMDAARALARRADADRGELALPERWRQQSLLLRK